MNKRTHAFTLPEALLALMVIGVIAAITIVVTSQNTHGHETIVKLKKAYAILTNSYENTASIYGPIYEWESLDSEKYVEMVSKSMTIAKNCKNATDLPNKNDCVPGCPKIYTTTKSLLDTCTSAGVTKLMTSDGYSYAFQIESASCGINVTDNSDDATPALKAVCGTAMTDLYPTKLGRDKNLYGADLFLFYITRDGVYPVGIAGDSVFTNTDSSLCKKVITEHIPGCTAAYLFDKTKIDE